MKAEFGGASRAYNWACATEAHATAIAAAAFANRTAVYLWAMLFIRRGFEVMSNAVSDCLRAALLTRARWPACGSAGYPAFRSERPGARRRTGNPACVAGSAGRYPATRCA